MEAVSARYIAAHRAKTAARRESAPKRRSFPKGFKLKLSATLNRTMIFVRRSDDNGSVKLLGRSFPVDRHWLHRLVRCQVDFTHQRIRFYAVDAGAMAWATSTRQVVEILNYVISAK